MAKQTSSSSPVDDLPFLTGDLPGIGGAIKQRNEDFLVEEIPGYPPCGEGDHVYFGVEKSGISTWEAISVIARKLGRKPRDFGYAGMKDAHAVTRQVISLEHIELERVKDLATTQVRVLWVSRHRNKLRLGHLQGNRFTIRVRNPHAQSAEFVEPLLDRLRQRGVPNYFGEQRFGKRGDNAAVGLALVRGDHREAIEIICGRPQQDELPAVRKARSLFDQGRYADAAKAWPRPFAEQRRLCQALQRRSDNFRNAWRGINRRLELLYLSAFQSELFNRWLAERLPTLDRVEKGDYAWRHANGAAFLVEDAAVEQPRCDAFEISPSGPLYGERLSWAQGDPGSREEQLLRDAGISPDEFGGKNGARLAGARRPARYEPRELTHRLGSDEHGSFVEVSFIAESGCYATSLIRELCRSTPG